MKWYVLQVLTGQEEDVAIKLRRRGVESLVPREYVVQRKGGKWKQRPRLLLPGYVLIHTDYSPALYFVLNAVPGIIRILGNNGTPIPLTELEEDYWTQGDWQPSRVHFHADGTWSILSGPLLKIPLLQIERVDRRQRRARVRLQVGAMAVTKDLAIEIA